MYRSCIVKTLMQCCSLQFTIFLMCSAHPDPCHVNYCVYLSIVIYACTHSALPLFLLIVVVHVVHDVNSAILVGLRSRWQWQRFAALTCVAGPSPSPGWPVTPYIVQELTYARNTWIFVCFVLEAGHSGQLTDKTNMLHRVRPPIILSASSFKLCVMPKYCIWNHLLKT